MKHVHAGPTVPGFGSGEEYRQPKLRAVGSIDTQPLKIAKAGAPSFRLEVRKTKTEVVSSRAAGYRGIDYD